MGCQGVRTGDGKLSNVGRDYGVDRVFDGEWADWWVETFEQDVTQFSGVFGACRPSVSNSTHSEARTLDDTDPMG